MALRIHLSELLGRQRMKQSELAELTGMRRATINAIYHERIKRFEVDQIESICKALDCQPGDLMTYDKGEGQ